ncbi:MAG: ATP-binding protein [Gemmatimonadetes bacterium]|nr:ATP-binding protein [Gemmatimonadota bacterium]
MTMAPRGPGEAIAALLGAHIELRNARRLQTAMRSARLPAVKTLADFDFSFSQPSIERRADRQSAHAGLLERKENVVLLRAAGRRKTHPALSLAVAVRPERTPGLHHPRRPAALARRGPGGRTLGPRLRTLVFPSLMVIDEIGYLRSPTQGRMLFFQLLESPLRARLHDPHQQDKGFEDGARSSG